MEQAFTLAGFFAAHALTKIANGEAVPPFLGTHTKDGKRMLQRFSDDDRNNALKEGRQMLRNYIAAPESVLAYQRLIRLPEGRANALFLEIQAHYPGIATAIMAVPFRPASRTVEFAIHRPKLLEVPAHYTEINILGTAFLSGINQHPKGSLLWSERLDATL
jgi:hypothetical protein